ncbi:porin [Paraburkholderia susongensis]|uniref:Outer membrane protein (Porin) n=1 Tax=Paraburkholderia susongensis TaxID=1515439 RepID=A0A1X7LYW1_9BURK|nr:porin [Paraburkholderia susongensis]SMG58289.1 Outer membrane protein (porin) [Paraburkholderia susongensis]
MKRAEVKASALAGTVLALSAATCQAQSNVTLYGIIDASIDYVSNEGGHHAIQAQNGMINGSRWGLKGQEDLGGGTSAIFQLENGFNIFNGKLGQGGRMFGRQAWIGLQDNRFGTVTFGRQYDPTIWYLAIYTGGFNGGTAFAHPFDNDNMGNSFRLDNSVEYTSPTWNGLSMRSMYAFSNQPGFKDNRAYSAGAGYSRGGLNLGTAFIIIDNVGTTAGGAVDGSSTGDATWIGSRQMVWGAAANYTYGNGTYGATWTHTRIDNGTSVNLGGYKPLGDAGMSLDNFDVNVTYKVTPAVALLGTYTYTMSRFTNSQVSARPKWNQFNAQIEYFLSKRTDVYLNAIYQHVSGGENTPFANAILCGYSQSSSPSQVVVGLGMRHRF